MSSDAYALNPDMLVGGQAVLDGVMMRSARDMPWRSAVPTAPAVDRDRVGAPARHFPLLKPPSCADPRSFSSRSSSGSVRFPSPPTISVPDEERPAGSRERSTTAAIAGGEASRTRESVSSFFCRSC